MQGRLEQLDAQVFSLDDALHGLDEVAAEQLFDILDFPGAHVAQYPGHELVPEGRVNVGRRSAEGGGDEVEDIRQQAAVHELGHRHVVLVRHQPLHLLQDVQVPALLPLVESRTVALEYLPDLRKQILPLLLELEACQIQWLIEDSYLETIFVCVLLMPLLNPFEGSP